MRVCVCESERGDMGVCVCARASQCAAAVAVVGVVVRARCQGRMAPLATTVVGYCEGTLGGGAPRHMCDKPMAKLLCES